MVDVVGWCLVADSAWLVCVVDVVWLVLFGWCCVVGVVWLVL